MMRFLIFLVRGRAVFAVGVSSDLGSKVLLFLKISFKVCKPLSDLHLLSLSTRLFLLLVLNTVLVPEIIRGHLHLLSAGMPSLRISAATTRGSPLTAVTMLPAINVNYLPLLNERHVLISRVISQAK